MAGYTREIWSVPQSGGKSKYQGYAKYDANNQFAGTGGGYGVRGRANSSLVRSQYSKLQRQINLAGARGASRNSAMRVRS